MSDRIYSITAIYINGPYLSTLMGNKTLVTSALLYANGPLHLGHLVEYVQTDIFVRYLRLKGDDVIYCCADDTHGAPIEINASKQGMTPKELISKSFKEHKRDFDGFKISFDNYYTTDSEENREYADKLFRIVKDKGYIYKKQISQLFCDDCGRFLPDRYVKGTCPKCGAEEQYGDVCEKCGSTHKPDELIDPKCSICGAEPREKESEHYFFKLSAFSDKLKEWLSSNPNLQKEIVNSVSHWIDEELQDWDISRDGPYFGFKIPEEDNLYYYVWWDAPIGYMASSENYCQNNGMGSAEDVYWKNDDSRIIHFIGKDIIYFHFLFWPAMLMASGYNVPKELVVHGFLTIDGEKMSKSRGTFITAEEYLKENDPEYLRFYYARMLSKKLSDVDYSVSEFESKINNELVANIGNLSYRVLSFSSKNFDGKISKVALEKDLMRDILEKVELVDKYYADVNYKEALKEILAISAIGNKYFQDNTPWKLVKEDKDKAEEILGFCLNIVKIVGTLMKPVMPGFSEGIEEQLNLSELNWDSLKEYKNSFELKDPKILLQKIEKKKEEKEQPKEEVQSDEKLMPFNLVVGQIKSIENHPDADKLYVMKIDIGSEERQVVAGLKPYIPAEELLDKKVILVKNLEYANLRGKESQGMVLAADHDDVVKVLSPKESVPGDRVYLEGFAERDDEINFKKFTKVKIKVNDKNVIIKGEALKTDKETIEIDMPDGSKVR